MMDAELFDKLSESMHQMSEITRTTTMIYTVCNRLTGSAEYTVDTSMARQEYDALSSMHELHVVTSAAGIARRVIGWAPDGWPLVSVAGLRLRAS